MTGHQGSLGRCPTAADVPLATVCRDCPGQGGSDGAGFFLRNFGLALCSRRILSSRVDKVLCSGNKVLCLVPKSYVQEAKSYVQVAKSYVQVAKFYVQVAKSHVQVAKFSSYVFL